MTKSILQETNPLNISINAEPFIDKHFAKIAFVISTLAMLILTPLATLLGTALIYAIKCAADPKLKSYEKIVTSQNAVIAIVGAFAVSLRLTPAGAAGSFIFRSTPLLSTYALGDTAYRAKALCLSH